MSVIRSSRSVASRQNIYSGTKEKGVIMSFRCSRCFEKNLECRVLPNATRYGECVKSVGSGRCDVYGHSAGDWSRVSSEEDRLRREEEAAVQVSQEAVAKILRLRKQQRVLREKAGKMLQHDLRTIEALEEFEAEEERLEKERIEREKSNPGSSAPADANSGVLDTFDPSS
ncbi:hypothetical protein SS1G_04938 [Sclerotinia sclerotiorum 1980 UF-70]|uniref:Uncharacterized protein n=2 Tax=Sclerotinia sclerotiorum (strain ATCC 18683 / 1980 / Ss-1) TaxID=665079 RepID=A7EHZ6_SCLS1|nr:hypothetical protein SS1G_04938 [Sclerotinia sclerotiorum 1980 UF-70]APA11525.1 hypothetical protein sscle_08g062950 [Sclerotinia sclerotiorum 1980 UF-70]EDO02462.1 hypothetical protein SS1G_04938 [Sclerotinia sclerotiorum 1980 UF-70]